MPNNDSNLFGRLTSLFKSGPIVKRKIRAQKPLSGKSTLDLFKKSQSSVFNNAVSAYGMYDRMSRYSDFAEMESTPEISTALDIYADETVATNEKGRSLHIFSENPKIKKILEELFYDTLNIEFNLNPWVRNLVKYGDFFLFLDVSQDMGIQGVLPIPVNEVEREEGFDPDDPMAIRFRWVTQGNKTLENWQLAHFRLLGNDAFLPYGSSVIEPARRVWRQLILIEDAMLVYRVIRSPERRVFKIDVGNVPPEEIPNYMEQAKAALRSSQVIDKNTGRVDLRYNPMSVDEDYFLPVRGQADGTSIDTLAGGTNVTAVEDVEYIQRKLFSALKVPKAYLGFDESLSSKATLAQEDIRFSRTIDKIQRVIISEMNKIAAIHLFSHGYDGEDLLDFNLTLSNPSTIAQQQKLELFRTKFEIAGSAPEGMVSKDYLRKNVLGLTNDEIQSIERQRGKEKVRDLEVESLTIDTNEDGSIEAEVPGMETNDNESGADDMELSGEEKDGSLIFGTPSVSIKSTLIDDEEFIPSMDSTGKSGINVSNKVSRKKPTQIKKSQHLRKKRNNPGQDARSEKIQPITAKNLSARDSALSTKGISDDLRSMVPTASGLNEVDVMGRYEKQHNTMTTQFKNTLKSMSKKISINNSNVKSSLLKEDGIKTDLGDKNNGEA